MSVFLADGGAIAPAYRLPPALLLVVAEIPFIVILKQLFGVSSRSWLLCAKDALGNHGSPGHNRADGFDLGSENWDRIESLLGVGRMERYILPWTPGWSAAWRSGFFPLASPPIQIRFSASSRKPSPFRVDVVLSLKNRFSRHSSSWRNDSEVI